MIRLLSSMLVAVVVVVAAWTGPGHAQTPNSLPLPPGAPLPPGVLQFPPSPATPVPGAPSTACQPPFTDGANCAHPALPWGPGQMRPPGSAVRTLEVPDRAVTLNVMVPQPGSLPPTWEPVTVVIPGFTATETTGGFWVPGHWTVVQVAGGGYGWRWAPPAFHPR